MKRVFENKERLKKLEMARVFENMVRQFSPEEATEFVLSYCNIKGVLGYATSFEALTDKHFPDREKKETSQKNHRSWETQ